MTIISYIFAPLIVLFVKSDGNLVLSWFGTSDNPAIGDALWKQNNPTLNDYELRITWMWRNPAQGFDQLLRANVTFKSPCKVYGNINIGDTDGISGYYLITCNGYFHFAYVLPIGFGHCVEGGLGWRLNNIVKGYEHPTMGQIAVTPFRFQKFGR